MGFQIIRKSEQLQTSWAGGTTVQLAIHPQDASLAARNFYWRLSSATVNQGGAFSEFRGYSRWLGLRQGAGMVLNVDNQQMQLKSAQQMLCFSGDAKTSAELIAGAVVDINLILAAGWQGGLQTFTLQPQQLLRPVVPTVAQEFLIYVDAGQLAFELADQEIMLTAGDLIRYQRDSGNTAMQIVEGLAGERAIFTAIEAATTAVLAWVAPL